MDQLSGSDYQSKLDMIIIVICLLLILVVMPLSTSLVYLIHSVVHFACSMHFDLLLYVDFVFWFTIWYRCFCCC